MTTPTHVLLIDGTCVFCNRLVAWILRHDPRGHFHFAHLQNRFARSALERHGGDPADLDGVYVIADLGTPAERLLVDGQAARLIYPSLFRLGFLVRLVPLFLLNPMYRLFARVRYRLFGRYDSCLAPTTIERTRFIIDGPPSA